VRLHLKISPRVIIRIGIIFVGRGNGYGLIILNGILQRIIDPPVIETKDMISIGTIELMFSLTEDMGA
jgi:hypothetical protein